MSDYSSDAIKAVSEISVQNSAVRILQLISSP